MMETAISYAGAGPGAGQVLGAEALRRTIRVMLADSQAIVLEGLRAIIGRAEGMEVVAQAADAPRALELCGRLRPEVVMTELSLPGAVGVDWTAALLRENPSGRVIVLTAHSGQEDIYRALQAGARSYLLKDSSGERVLSAIRAVASGQRYLPDSVAERLAERVSGSQLTARELDVLRQIARGRSNKEIALALGISESTVKGHVNNILCKMNVGDRTQAVTAALKRGMIRLEEQ